MAEGHEFPRGERICSEMQSGAFGDAILKGFCQGISQSFGPNYPEISGSQVNPLRTFSLNV